jgi:hypothetical protein
MADSRIVGSLNYVQEHGRGVKSDGEPYKTARFTLDF